MKDFDVILDMDWLGYNYVAIHCRERELCFQKPREEQFSFPIIKTKPHLQLVSILQVEKMLKKKSKGFLVNIPRENR